MSFLSEAIRASLPVTFVFTLFLLQPDKGAKRLREEDGGTAGGEEDAKGGKQQKGLSARELARYREAEGELDGLTGDKKKILDKLMDQDEEEPEVGEAIVSLQHMSRPPPHPTKCQIA